MANKKTILVLGVIFFLFIAFIITVCVFFHLKYRVDLFDTNFVESMTITVDDKSVVVTDKDELQRLLRYFYEKCDPLFSETDDPQEYRFEYQFEIILSGHNKQITFIPTGLSTHSHKPGYFLDVDNQSRVFPVSGLLVTDFFRFINENYGFSIEKTYDLYEPPAS